MPLPCINSPKAFFFQIFTTKEQKEDRENLEISRKKYKISQKNRDKLSKFGIMEYRSIISYQFPPKTETSLIFRPKFRKFCFLCDDRGSLYVVTKFVTEVHVFIIKW